MASLEIGRCRLRSLSPSGDDHVRFLTASPGYARRSELFPGDEEGTQVPIWSRGFSRNLEAAGEARGFVRQVLSRRIHPQVLADVLLMTSELAINGARHVPKDRGDRLEVLIDHDDEVLRISVRDPGTDFDPADITRVHEIGGWGLRLVSALSSRWGVEPRSDGTDVWFEVDRPTEGTGDRPAR